MWLAKLGKELLNGSEQLSVSTEEVYKVCVLVSKCVTVHPGRRGTDFIIQLYMQQRIGLCSYKSAHPLASFPTLPVRLRCPSLFHQFSCFSVIYPQPPILPPPLACLTITHLFVLGPWRPTLTPNGCNMKCFSELWKHIRGMMQHAAILVWEDRPWQVLLHVWQSRPLSSGNERLPSVIVLSLKQQNIYSEADTFKMLQYLWHLLRNDFKFIIYFTY